MRILVDTNVLLRATLRSDALNSAARTSLRTLHRQGHELCITPQNVREFWNVCTRPVSGNGLEMSKSTAERHVKKLEKYFTVLPDSTKTYREWRILLTDYEILGKQVHDAYLVAAMKAQGIAGLLTFDTGDFVRFKDIEVIDPRRV